MNKAVPWSIKGVDFNAREAAEEAARRSGMTLGEWLNSVIADQADELGIDPQDIDDTQRVEAVSRRLAHMAPRDHYPPARAERVDLPHADEDQEDLSERQKRRAERRAAMRLRGDEDRYGAQAEPRQTEPRHGDPRQVNPRLVDHPRVDHPQVDRPQVDHPQVDRPQVDRPQVDRPQVDRPQVDRPQVDRPQVDPRQDDHYTRGPSVPSPRGPYRSQPVPSAYDGPYETGREMDSQRDADALLDDAVHGLERGSRRHHAQTNATLDKFSRRLAELESHLNERAEQAAETREERRAKYRNMVRDEPRAKSDGDAHMAAIDRKLSRLMARLEEEHSKASQPQVSPHAVDIERIEAKLNTLLNRPSAPPPPSYPQPAQSVPQPAGPRYATPRPPSRQPLADALSQITRRQRDLENVSGAATRHLRDTRPPDAVAPVSVEPTQSAHQLASLQTDIAKLAASIETIRGELSEKTSALQSGPSEIELLRKQIGEMNAAVATLAPREAFASLENATRELVQRVESSRQEGVRENILQPIETLVSHLQRAMAEFSPSATIDTIRREIGVIAQNIAAVGSASVDTATLAKLNDQTREIRDLLVAAAARPVPIDNIERQISGLAKRMDLIAQRGSTPSGSRAVSESVDAIRQAVESILPTSLLHTLEQRVEALGRKIDEAVYNEPSNAPIETGALESMMRDIAARLDRPPPPVSNDLSQLEDSMRELARRVDTAGKFGATPAAFDALQEQIERLAQRLDQSDASLGRLPDLHRSIADIIGMLEENRAASVNAAENAARLAARDALAQMGPVAAADDGLRTQIAQEIANLRNGQDATDRKTRATLTAVHETLEKVVDRLAMIEGGLENAAASALPMATLDPLVRAQNMAADTNDTPSTLASGPAPSFTRAGAASAYADEPATQRPARTPPPVEAPPASLEDDILIEPGSGASPARRSLSGAARAESSDTDASRVDLSRATPQAAALASDEAPGSAQQSFIAAARRAREAAVSDASRQPRSGSREAAPQRASGDNALAEARARAKAAAAALAAEPVDETEGLGPIGRARAFINHRKRPILLSLAGIVLALGALTVARSMQEAPPVDRATVGMSRPDQRGSGLKIQAQATDRARASDRLARAAPGVGAPVTADEVAALGNNFVRDPNPVPSGEASSFRPPAQPLPTFAKADAAAKSDAAVKSDVSPVGSIPAEPMALPSAPKGADLRAAASAGDPTAQFELGVRLFEGRGVTRDFAQAAQWFEKAALQNFAPAQYRLGSLYEKGLGVKRDSVKAKTLYQRAADRGNIRAMHNLAVLYAEGADAKPDYTAAAQWFRKAAEYGVRDSQYNLAILYARGLGVAQNISQSWVWFSLASAQGDEDAGKKRNDVSARLNPAQLAAAKAVVENFKPRVGDKASNDVVEPPGGWSLSPATASAPKPEKRSTQTIQRPRMTAL